MLLRRPGSTDEDMMLEMSSSGFRAGCGVRGRRVNAMTAGQDLNRVIYAQRTTKIAEPESRGGQLEVSPSGRVQLYVPAHCQVVAGKYGHSVSRSSDGSREFQFYSEDAYRSAGEAWIPIRRRWAVVRCRLHRWSADAYLAPPETVASSAFTEFGIHVVLRGCLMQAIFPGKNDPWLRKQLKSNSPLQASPGPPSVGDSATLTSFHHSLLAHKTRAPESMSWPERGGSYLRVCRVMNWV